MAKSNLRTAGICAAAIALILLFVSLITLVMLAPYTAPVADDFGYGAPVYYAIQAGAGIPGVFAAIAENIRYTYMNWQGTFGSVLLFSLQPSAFSEALYAITPLFMLAIIIVPGFLALGTLRSVNKAGVVIIGSVIAFLSVQYLPSPGEGIYWWNGAAHYLVFWCLAVLVTTQQIRLSRLDGHGRTFYALSAVGCVGALFVGGGNYSTALVLVLVLGALTVFSCVEKHPRRVVIANALLTVFALGGLVISMAAPGNAIRQAGLASLPVPAAVGLSLQQAALGIVGMTDAKILGALLVCVPLFLFSVRKSGYRFRLPLLVLLFSFGAFAALYTPPIYAMGTSNVPRMNNLFWLAYLFLVFGSAFYLAGWAAQHIRVSRPKRAGRIGAAVCAAGAVVLVAAVFVQMRTSNAYLAYSDIRSGVLETYRQERQARVAVYNDKSILSPRFEPITRYPECFPKVPVLTWMSDLLVVGIPTALPCYHACGGEVSFVALNEAMALLSPGKSFALSDFSKTFYIGGKTCVPLRELCDQLGLALSYHVACDTIRID